MIDICENGLAYDGALLVGAIREFVETLDQEGTMNLQGVLQVLQKRLKYGLPTANAIALYEIGLADRVVAQDLADTLSMSAVVKDDVKQVLNQNRHVVSMSLKKFPKYFSDTIDTVLAE